jgi:hypothetical protein
MKKIFLKCINDVKSTASAITECGVQAAAGLGQSAASEMLKSTVPCLIAVKRLIVIAKDITALSRERFAEEFKKRDAWRRECLQNERVKQLFQMWETQIIGESPTSNKKIQALSPQEIEMLEDPTDGLLIETTSRGQVVKGGKLPQLVQVATRHSDVDENFVEAVLMTHHSFTTSVELLDQLIKRYEITPPYGLNQRMFEIYVDRKIVQVKLRVCNMLQKWIETHFEEDFLGNELLIIRFKEFVESKVLHDFENTAVSLLHILKCKIGEEEKPIVDCELTLDQLSKCPKPWVPKIPIEHMLDDPRGILEMDPLELARQLTILEFNLFAKVPVHECLDQIWRSRRRKEAIQSNSTKKVGNESGANITRLINHTNQLGYWVAFMIISSQQLKTRVNTIKFFIQVITVNIRLT